MKKALAVIMTLVMLLCVCSCGKEAAVPPVSETQQSGTPSPETKEPEKKEDTVPVEKTPTVEETAEKCMNLYYGFLKGEQLLTIKEDCEGFASGEKFRLDQFCETYKEYIQPEWGEFYGSRVKYAFLDSGSDGIPELAIELALIGEEGGFGDVFKDFIIYCEGDVLTLAAGFDYYYRSYVSLRDSGIVENGGSSGAASYECDFSWIKGNGNTEFLYSSSVDVLGSRAAIPYYMLPSSFDSEYYDMYEDTGAYYSVEAISFNKFDFSYDDPKYDEYRDKYYSECVFIITDEEGRDTDPDPEFAALYEEAGIKIASTEEAKALIDQCLKEKGVSEEMMSADYLEFELLDVEMLNDEVIENEGGSVTVGCTGNLMTYIEDGATIYLKPGVYNLSDWAYANGTEYYYDEVNICRACEDANAWNRHIYLCGEQIYINRVNDLTICSVDPNRPAELVIDEEFNYVLFFNECSDLTLKDIVAGHSKGHEGLCSSDVFHFTECDRVTMEECDLYGCGSYGFSASGCFGINMNGGRIHDCTSGMVMLDDTKAVCFNGVRFENCTETYAAMFYALSSTFNFENCSFKNLGEMFWIEESYAWLGGCTFDESAKKSVEGCMSSNDNIYVFE